MTVEPVERGLNELRRWSDADGLDEPDTSTGAGTLARVGIIRFAVGVRFDGPVSRLEVRARQFQGRQRPDELLKERTSTSPSRTLID